MKRFSRKVGMALACVLLVLSSTAFAQTAKIAGLAVKKDGSPYMLGVVANEMRSGWMTAWIGYSKSLWERMGGRFNFFVSEYNMDVELAQMTDLMQLKPDCIFVHPSDSHAIVPAVDKARAAGYPVIAVDVGVTGTAVDGFVHINQQDMGKGCAQYVAKAFSASNPAVVLELCGGLEQDIAIERRDGFDNEVKNVPYIKIVQEIDTKWSADTAMQSVQDALERDPTINCIYGHSDFFVQGILQGLKLKNKLIPAGQKGHIVVCSIDGDPTGLKGIRDGFIDADAENNPVLFAAVAVNMAIAKVHGLDIPSEIVLSPAVITKATVGAPERWGLLPSGQFEKWPVLNQSFFKIPASLLK